MKTIPITLTGKPAIRYYEVAAGGAELYDARTHGALTAMGARRLQGVNEEAHVAIDVEAIDVTTDPQLAAALRAAWEKVSCEGVTAARLSALADHLVMHNCLIFVMNEERGEEDRFLLPTDDMADLIDEAIETVARQAKAAK